MEEPKGTGTLIKMMDEQNFTDLPAGIYVELLIAEQYLLKKQGWHYLLHFGYSGLIIVRLLVKSMPR